MDPITMAIVAFAALLHSKKNNQNPPPGSAGQVIMRNMGMVKEIKGLKCKGHDYLRDNYNFMYEEQYPGCKPHQNTRCVRCGYTMSLHNPQKV